MMRRWLSLLAVVGLSFGFALVLVSCQAVQAVTEVGTSAAAAAGIISEQQAKAITRSTEAIVKASEVLTPENEYYIGRAVGATILSQYPPVDNPKANRYINTLGQALAMASDMPQTYGGYRFLILDSDEVNAFAAPGGFIFVTRGMIRCCRHESALAAVLAHEIGHVQCRHGLASIRQGRITQATVTVLGEGAKAMGGETLKQLTEQFQGTVEDITKTLIVNGYSRAAEKEADTAAVEILRRVGYNPAALLEMLEAMTTRVQPGGPGFGKTHPPPADRIKIVQGLIGPSPAPVEEPPVRQTRFSEALRGVL